MAVGMNIDIASIDMVSEVNMVSTNAHRYVSVMGTVWGLCSHWGGMLEYMHNVETVERYIDLEFMVCVIREQLLFFFSFFFFLHFF